MHCVDVRSELSLLPSGHPFLLSSLLTSLTLLPPFTLYISSYHSVLLLPSISPSPFHHLPSPLVNQPNTFDPTSTSNSNPTPNLSSHFPHLQLALNSSSSPSTDLCHPPALEEACLNYLVDGHQFVAKVVGLGFERRRRGAAGVERDIGKRGVYGE